MDRSVINFINGFVIVFLGTILLNVLVKLAAPHLRALVRKIRGQFTPEEWAQLMIIVRTGVQFAEQTGLTSSVKLAGSEKFNLASQWILAALAQTPLAGVDPFLLKGAIESSVLEFGKVLIAESGYMQALPPQAPKRSSEPPGLNV